MAFRPNVLLLSASSLDNLCFSKLLLISGTSPPFDGDAPEKSSDDDERPIAHVLKNPGQPRSTDPTVSSHSKKSKKHKRSTATGSEPTSHPSSQHSHKSKSHQGHKRKKHDSPSRSGETKKKRHHKVLTPEAPALDADTIMVDTSILNKALDPAMGASQSTSTPAVVVLGKENPDAVSPASTQQADASAEPSHPVADYTPWSPASSPAHPLQSVDTVGEFIGFPIQISDSDSNSVTSPATYTDSSSTSSDSSLSSASLLLQDPRGPGLAIKPSALEAIARIRNLVRSRDASSDSEQLHQSGKLGSEATKTKVLMDKVHFHALNPDLPFVLMHEPVVGLEILRVLAQLKDLQLSEYAKRATAALEQLLVPMLRHLDNVRENERQIASTEAFVKEKWELVMNADAEVTVIR
ncbi:suppressor protein SRP40-like [Lathyrus oleraceus]|uniref:suppressor protein SRP40-like n=1 Tax=Pisum sativum TaxID=3888 RepID=UPI0021CDF78A|nr:suppressor protein SRP40-like [Pisum sativum]